jgi:hypothetical protein
MPAAGAVRSDKIRITELTDCTGAILLVSCPEVTSTEPTEDSRATRVRSFTLQSEKDFFNAITHALCFDAD